MQSDTGSRFDETKLGKVSSNHPLISFTLFGTTEDRPQKRPWQTASPVFRNRHQHPPRARPCSERCVDRSLISGGGSVVTSRLNAMNEARNEGGTYQRVEVITGRQRRDDGRRREGADRSGSLRRTRTYRMWHGVTAWPADC